MIYNCQVCGIYLYSIENNEQGISSGICPHCFLIITKLQEYMSDHRGVVSEVISKILRDYQKDIKPFVMKKIKDGKYQGRIV